MSATMARQGGRVQLEQSDMRLALNMAKMAKEGFSRDALEETQKLIKKPRAELREEKRRGVQFPGHKSVKAIIGSHPAMQYENQLDGCLPCQNGVARNPATRWRRKGTAAGAPRGRRAGSAQSVAPVAPLPTPAEEEVEGSEETLDEDAGTADEDEGTGDEDEGTADDDEAQPDEDEGTTDGKAYIHHTAFIDGILVTDDKQGENFRPDAAMVGDETTRN
jgi:hypothetical protein